MANEWIIVVSVFTTIVIAGVAWIIRIFMDARKLRRRIRERLTDPEIAAMTDQVGRYANLYADALINRKLNEYRKTTDGEPDGGK